MWMCSQCTFLNEDWRNKCKMCRSIKSQEDYGACGGKNNSADKVKDDYSSGCTCSTKTYQNKCQPGFCKSGSSNTYRSPDRPYSSFCKSESSNSYRSPDRRYSSFCKSGSSDTYRSPGRPLSAVRNFKDENETRIVLIGRTGSGKSATGNTLLGSKQFRSLVSGSSVTGKCKRGEAIRNGKKIIIVDTPGLFDTSISNDTVTKEIVKCIGMTSPGPHAVVHVVSIGRFTQEEKDTVKHFVDHFGEGVLKYMIVLFTRKDELMKTRQSIHEYVQTVPTELKSILHQCGDRYITFNNDAVGREKDDQVQEFFHSVDLMVSRNGHSCYTNDVYEEAEAALQRRMNYERERMEIQKNREKDEIRRQIELRYQRHLEQEVIEKSRLEDVLKTVGSSESSDERDITTEITGLKKRLNDKDRASSNDPIARQDMERRIQTLEQQLKAAEISKEKDRKKLQRDLEQSNRRLKKQMDKKEKELKQKIKQKEENFKTQMATENLRKRERDNVENENGGTFSDILNGIANVGKCLFKMLF